MSQPTILAIILAGGQATRMQGQDKGLLLLHGKPLVQWVIERLQPQLQTLVINANRNTEIYQQWNYPVLADLPIHPQQGPLGGIASVMATLPADYYLTVPCDCPRLPLDLLARLQPAALPACAHDGQRLQPLFSLLPAAVLLNLQAYLASGQRHTQRWLEAQGVHPVDFADQAGAFANLNTPDELYELSTNPAGLPIEPPTP